MCQTLFWKKDIFAKNSHRVKLLTMYIGAHHPLLGLLDLVALPPVSSLQLKVGHPAQGQGCHQGGNQGRHQYGIKFCKI